VSSAAASAAAPTTIAGGASSAPACRAGGSSLISAARAGPRARRRHEAMARRQLDLFAAPDREPAPAVAGAKRAIPRAAYACTRCRSRCSCHDLEHVDCPYARAQACAGGCGRQTTEAESCRPGYCRSCAHPPPAGQGAWRVQAMVPTQQGERMQRSAPLSYGDALELGRRLDRAGARGIRLVECEGPRPRSRPSPRPPPAPPGQLQMFTRRKGRGA
jgi:hypothetical protein